MNTPDPFEQKLRSLQPQALPPEWRAEILGRAAVRPARRGPPKWLAWSWAASLAAAMVLSLLTPTVSQRDDFDSAGAVSSAAMRQRTELLNALLARSDFDSSPLLP